MKLSILILICAFQAGCNYSLSKTPLAFTPGGGAGALQDLPAGKVVGYQTIKDSIMSKCIECHSASGGDEGGINLETYANVAANLGIIQSEVESNSMPKNRPKLSAKEKEILFAWIAAGGPLNAPSATETPVVVGPPIIVAPEPEPNPAPTPVPNPNPVPSPDPIPAPVPDPTPDVEFISYEMVHTKVIQPRCLNCHSDAGGNRGEINLETYENVVSVADLIEAEIRSGSMPRPRNKPLTPEQKELILKWITNGTPKN